LPSKSSSHNNPQHTSATCLSPARYRFRQQSISWQDDECALQQTATIPSCVTSNTLLAKASGTASSMEKRDGTTSYPLLVAMQLTICTPDSRHQHQNFHHSAAWWRQQFPMFGNIARSKGRAYWLTGILSPSVDSTCPVNIPITMNRRCLRVFDICDLLQQTGG
jgi:hypothetical protein